MSIFNEQTFAERAERKKFVPVSSITGLSAEPGDEKYAVVTYIANVVPISGTVTVPELSGIDVTIPVLNATQIRNVTVPANSAVAISFSPATDRLQIWNDNTSSTLYYLPSSTTDYDTVTAYGMAIEKFYSDDYTSSGLTIATNQDSFVRIHGKYTV